MVVERIFRVPRGGNIILGLVDSTVDSTGTIGYVSVRRSDPNRTEIARIDQYGRFLTRTCVAPLNGVNDLVSGTATPDMSQSGSIQKTNNTVATTITNFLNGSAGQSLTLFFGDALTTVANNATISLAGGANFTGAVGNSITFIFDGSVWQEQYRRTT